MYVGTETLTFIATDEEGLSTEATMEVTIEAGNEAPIVKTPLEAVEVEADFEEIVIDLNKTFSDDRTVDESLTYEVSGNENLEVEIIDGIAVITAPEGYVGTETLTFIATDEEGKSTETMMEVTIDPINESPIVENPVKDVEVEKGFEEIVIDLNEAFGDDHTGDGTLEYAVSGNDDLVVEIVDGIATITAPEGYVGTEELVFTATDEGGNVTEMEVEIAVDDNLGTSVSTVTTSNVFTVYPNPTTSSVHVVTLDGATEVGVYDMRGFRMSVPVEGMEVDLSSLPTGVYLIKQGENMIKVVKED